MPFERKQDTFDEIVFFQKNEIYWHGHDPNHPDWSYASKVVAFSIQDLYVVFNADHTTKFFTLPNKGSATCMVNTAEIAPYDFVEDEQEMKVLKDKVKVLPYSALILKLANEASKP